MSRMSLIIWVYSTATKAATASTVTMRNSAGNIPALEVLCSGSGIILLSWLLWTIWSGCFDEQLTDDARAHVVVGLPEAVVDEVLDELLDVLVGGVEYGLQVVLGEFGVTAVVEAVAHLLLHGVGIEVDAGRGARLDDDLVTVDVAGRGLDVELGGAIGLGELEVTGGAFAGADLRPRVVLVGDRVVEAVVLLVADALEHDLLSLLRSAAGDGDDEGVVLVRSHGDPLQE